ncbi:inhibin beta C chain [Tachyglossus aculeatus]|uniref:inhibin beta C chain n=1 Tax=Tachyglossus aculeatus TaxID=9261 RepID=UPI0018F33F06|nr:inhibin beta C chain [Tachyglossus aculeatus]
MLALALGLALGLLLLPPRPAPAQDPAQDPAPDSADPAPAPAPAPQQCAVCAGSGPGLGRSGERAQLLALARHTILSKLRLQQRPPLPRPVPGAALQEALRRLSHRGGPGAGPGGTQGNNQWGPGALEPEYEIISFASEQGPAASPQPRLDLQFSPGRGPAGDDVEILELTLSIFLALPANGSGTARLRLLSPPRPGANLSLAAEQLLQVSRSGWHRLSLGPPGRDAWGQGLLMVQVEVVGSTVQADGDHRPFVVARARAGRQRRARRQAPDCKPGARMCCRHEFFVDFRELGWGGWILQPEGYTMNYCAGQCPLHLAGSPGIAASFHAALLSLLKANQAPAPATSSCCVPTAWRPLSLLYLDPSGSVVKADVPDMVVEACGCS